MRMITTAELRKQPEKTKLDDETLIVAAMTTEVSVRADDADGGAGESRTLDFTISNETADSYKDVVSADGWNLERFTKNPVVLWAHNRGILPVGKASDVRVDGDALKASAEFATKEQNPFAENVFQMLKAGFLKAVSVGFIPLEWTWDDERGGYNFLKNELFEFSVVPVPANPDALQNALKSGLDLGPLKDWCEETLDLWRPDGHVAMWVPRSSVEAVHQMTTPGQISVPSHGDLEAKVDMTALNVTSVGGTYEPTITDDPYSEFWSPNAQDRDDVATSTTWTYPPVDHELRSEVAELRKVIDALIEKMGREPEAEDLAVENHTDDDADSVDIVRILLDEDNVDFGVDSAEDDGSGLTSEVRGDIVEALKAINNNSAADGDEDPAGEINQDVLREAVRELATDAITKRTGKLPKEV